MLQYFSPIYAAPWVAWIVSSLIIIVSGIALYFDLRWRIIPNWLTYGALFTGLLLNGVLAGGGGLISALMGMVAASAVFLPLFFMGGFGGGDVKLMAALGAIGGCQLACNILLITAITGGFLGLLQVIFKGAFRQIFHRLFLLVTWQKKALNSAAPEQQLSMPYGLAIALGCLATVILQYTGNLLI